MFRRILLALDDFDSGAASVAFVADMAHQFGASVWIFGVEEHRARRQASLSRWDTTPISLEGQATAALQRVGVVVSGATRMDRDHQLVAAIAGEAARFDADLIVLGLARTRIAHHHFAKGIQEQLARISPLPVMVAPSPTSTVSQVPVAERTMQPQ